MFNVKPRRRFNTVDVTYSGAMREDSSGRTRSSRKWKGDALKGDELSDYDVSENYTNQKKWTLTLCLDAITLSV